MFCPHSHGDHYAARAFEWRKEIPRITYVMGFKTDKQEVCTCLEPWQQQAVAGMKIATVASTDSGVARAAGMRTPWVCAGNCGDAWRPYEGAVNVLLDAGAELFVNTPRGEKLMFHAAGGDSLRIVESLVGRGLDVNRQDRFGWAPLHIAAEQGRRETIAYLVRQGADINVRNMLGQTPYNIAREREDSELAAFLATLKADTADPKFPRIEGKYLGRPRPGWKPEDFAPGIVSHRYRPHSTVAVSPGGDEIFWNPMIESRGGGYTYGYLVTTRLENGYWT
jgi:hypothetical protein